MRSVAPISDLHLEFGSEPYVDLPESDILVLAGDITVAPYLKPNRNDSVARKNRKGFYRLMHRISQKPYELVIAIMGNHEAYHGSIDEIPEIMREAYAAFGIVFLHNQILETHDWRFVGGPLWTNFGGNPLNMLHAQNSINDYRQIRVGNPETGERLLRPQDTAMEHQKTLAVIQQFLDAPLDSRARCVITHHLPSYQSVAERFRNSENSAYASQLDSMVEKADVWIHGHTHDFCDYHIGDCRVVCNPLGYNGFEPIGLKTVNINTMKRLA
jgi:predicted phosphodiesterase